jgi:tetratricopeptide (TPR) repeat protein
MNADAVSQLTKLLAAHGVYALTILFIFYQQRRTYSDFLSASAENRLFLQRIYKSAVIATYVLAALSTGAWAYATFRAQPYVWVGGAIDDVRNESAQPADPKDPPAIVESIEPQGGGLQQFLSKTENCDPKTRLCQLRWVLRTRSDVPSVLFKFRHTYVIAKPKPSAADPNESAVRALIYESDTIDARFTLDTAAMDLHTGRELSLTYVRDKDPKRIGKLYFRRADQGLVPVLWETLPHDSPPASLNSVAPVAWLPSPARWWTVFAAERAPTSKASFGSRGEYDEAFAQGLRSWLGGASVDNQLMAVRILVDARARAFKFMADTQKTTLPAGVNASVMTGNLVRAAEQIEASGTKLPASLLASLAVASSKNGSYETSARLFDRTRVEPLSELEAYFYRGLAYRETKRYGDAIPDLEKFATDVASPYSKAVTFTSLGISYRRNGQPDKAVGAYERAIKAYPDYPGAYNSLAYLYALDRKRTDFSAGLDLVDQALKLRPNDPNYLDTKGWLLFRAGRYEEAEALLETAASAQPENAEIREHLDQVRKARTRTVQLGKG